MIFTGVDQQEHGPLKDDEDMLVKGSSSNYMVSRRGATYSCSCQAWLFQKRNPHARTCKHLKELRGEERELARINGSSSPIRVTKPSPSNPTPSPSPLVPELLMCLKHDNELTPEGECVACRAEEILNELDPLAAEFAKISEEECLRLSVDPRVSHEIRVKAIKELERRA